MGTLIKSGGQKSLTVGGFNFDWDPKNNPNDIQLAAAANDGTVQSNHIARLLNGTSGYQVPAGRTLTVVAMKTFNWAASAAGVGLGYGDTDVGVSSTPGPTNPIGLAAGGYLYQANASIGATAEIGGLNANVPAGKYVNVNSLGQSAERATTILYCKLN